MAIKIFDRKPGSKSPKLRVLIVCEGQETEPNYFRDFRIPKNVQSFDVKGAGRNTLSLVKHAQVLSLKEKYKEVWCVFDKDSFTRAQVNSAFALAEKLGFKCAFSNEGF